MATWLFGVARNVVRDHLRAGRRWTWRPVEWLSHRTSGSPDPEQAVLDDERRRHLADAEPAAQFGWRRARVLAPAIVAAVIVLVAAIPGARRALALPLLRILESVFVGEHTQITQFGPQTPGQVEKSLQEFHSGLADGRRWFVYAPYSGIGGDVPPGKSAKVHRVETLGEIPTLTDIPVQVPAMGSLGEPTTRAVEILLSLKPL